MSRLGVYSVQGKMARERPANTFTIPKALKCEGASTSHHRLWINYGRSLGGSQNFANARFDWL